MIYKEVIEYLFGQLPIFQRVGAAAYKADMSNTIAICKIIENPENDFPSVHIAGTNGKGSTSNMIASILQEAGFKTGLFTSPHLKDFRERIRVDGVMISENFVIDFVEKYKSKTEQISASFFELTFAMAMKYFSSQNIDIAVVEVGMGGRLDSTNVVKPLVSVITNISLDHTMFLGDTLSKIAFEKAGIFKENVPIIIGRHQEETVKVFFDVASKNKSRLAYADEIVFFKDNKISDLGEFSYSFDNRKFIDVKSYLIGDYQNENLKTALASLKILSENPKFEKICDDRNIVNGLKNLYSNTHFFGRWQILSTKPITICDTGHNEDGIKFITEQIARQKFNKLHLVIGMVSDKDIDKILKFFPKEATYYFCKANIPRGLDANVLLEKALDLKLIGKAYDSVDLAFIAAKESAKNDDMIFIGGSTYVVAEIAENYL